MDDEWDEDNFDPEPKVPTVVDRWEGEDEDDDVKDNWEDEEEDKEEKKDVEKQDDDLTSKAVQVKKSKKTLIEKIEEKERLAKEELEQKLKAKQNQLPDDEEEEEEEVVRELTPEEKYAEKMKQQKLQEEADLRVALETFGIKGEPSSGAGLDSIPSTQEEFNEYQTLLISKIDSLSKSAYFPVFAEEIVRNICLNLPLVNLKKLKSTVEVISTEKLKLEKSDKKKKGKGKAQLRYEGNAALLSEYSAYKDLEDYDDFM